MTVISVFTHCVQAIRNNVLIERVSATDKEFHFGLSMVLLTIRP